MPSQSGLQARTLFPYQRKDGEAKATILLLAASLSPPRGQSQAQGSGGAVPGAPMGRARHGCQELAVPGHITQQARPSPS